ncbi:MAG: DUF2723 domain-containing protein [Candidatus Latescibacteria bacterium]|nr:DUF2723 domain-containing protein [Candidatus Latescibacterota bacterium]
MSSRSINKIAALCVFLAVLAVYMMTVSPTISFWDSAEFITCSYIMGIPHPPGAPLLSLVGRVMSVIPLYDFRGGGFADIAYRLNIIAVIAGAFTVMLTYLIIVKLITRVSPFREHVLHDGTVMFSAAVAALMAAFSHQFWENSLEIETYMPSLFLSMAALWLTLTWEENKDNHGAIRYLLCAAYLIGLGNGIHLYVMLIVPVIVLLAFMAKPGWFGDSRLWLVIAVSLLIFGMVRFAGGRGILYLVSALFTLAGPYAFSRLYSKRSSQWALTLLGVLLCLTLYTIGYSVYPTIVVRASKSPVINEGNPDSWERYTNYLDREQYAQGNMYTGMMARNGSFGYQFGFMGIRYLLEQFPHWGPGIGMKFTNNRSADHIGMKVLIEKEVTVSIGFWLLIICGMIFHLWRDPKKFGVIFLYFFTAFVGLILYLNMKNPEVRERDYFFLGSYQIVTVWLGFGIFYLFNKIQTLLEKQNNATLTTSGTLVIVVVVATMVPSALLSRHVDPDYTNYRAHDRSKNMMPLDYGINMLDSCPPDAILFTNGDNDTYPLWYAREVLGLRRDVRIVNLSLLNAPWYIKQLRDEDVTVPIALNDKFIDERLCGNTLLVGRTRQWTIEPKEVTIAGMTWNMPPSLFGSISGKRVGFLSVSGYMVAHIIKENNWSRPIYFGVTVDPSAMIGLFEHMSMEGMVYRLVKDEAPPNMYHIDAVALDRNIFERYTYRGISDPEVYKSPDTVNLMQNYSMAFIRLCEKYIEIGNLDGAVRAADGAMELTIPDLDRRMLLYSTLCHGGLSDECDRFVTREIDSLLLDDRNISVRTGIWFLTFKMYESALKVFERLAERYSEDTDVLKGLISAYYSLENYGEALKVTDRLLTIIPGDVEIRQNRETILKKMESIQSP